MRYGFFRLKSPLRPSAPEPVPSQRWPVRLLPRLRLLPQNPEWISDSRSFLRWQRECHSGRCTPLLLWTALHHAPVQVGNHLESSGSFRADGSRPSDHTDGEHVDAIRLRTLGATRALRLAFWIEVSRLDTDLPAKADKATSFNPKSKLANWVSDSRTGPMRLLAETFCGSFCLALASCCYGSTKTTLGASVMAVLKPEFLLSSSFIPFTHPLSESGSASSKG